MDQNKVRCEVATTQVAIGAICKSLLREFGIKIISHVVNLCGIESNADGLTFEELESRAESNELRVADPPVPAELHDRAADNWRPLLAIADAAGANFGFLASGANSVPVGLFGYAIKVSAGRSRATAASMASALSEKSALRATLT